MGNISLKGSSVHTAGELPKVGAAVPDFKLTKIDLSDVSLANYQGKRKVLNIFPSVDTGTFAMSVRKFNETAAKLANTVILCISQDLPFAQKRFCGAEGLNNVKMLSAVRSTFSADWKVKMTDGPLAGL